MNRQEIWKLIDERSEDLLKLCSDMIAIPSVNPPGDVQAIVHYITNYLTGHGIAYEIVGERKDRPNILARYGTPGHKTGRFLTGTVMWCLWGTRKNGIFRHFPVKSEMV